MANVKIEPRIYIYTSCVYLDRREKLFVYGKYLFIVIIYSFIQEAQLSKRDRATHIVS